MTLDEALTEAEQLEHIGREFADYAKVKAEWSDRWPGHCAACRGWGSIPFAHHEDEILSVPCEALESGV
jgi:hypothetical protein